MVRPELGGLNFPFKSIRLSGNLSPDIITRMTLTLKEVEHIALLARLDLTQEEKERYQQQLSAILDHVAQLQELDTSDIKTTSSVLPPRSRLREDEALRRIIHPASAAECTCR